MTRRELGGGVAARLAGPCLDEDGRLRSFVVWDVAARGALLVDLARADRPTEEADGIVIDGRPIGFGPADRLLAAIRIEPEPSSDGWGTTSVLPARPTAG